ncbi:MAG: 1-deoxy-D-xylulose-5-phosphate synthase [Clostridium sp.]|nr:1-deoxy-D-xylulose-5-phosphate synthase [Clostridium sp.]
MGSLKDNKAEEPERRPLDPVRYPLLSRIDSPADLRALDQGQLPQVCSEMRDFLVSQLSVNPGHFASSMGSVELTVALHYVFNTPYDRIVWDVGHQAYGHKILTGRGPLFHLNRRLGGLSGFPNPDESEYDTFSAGHASNSISAALGMAVAAHLRSDEPRRNVVAVIGDASISGGLAFEGLNNAANSKSNLLIILNDNDMSIDRNVGSLNSYLANLTTSKSYNTFRYRTYRLMRRLGFLSERQRGSILRLNNSLKSFLTNEQNIFEGLNIRYFGPFDGHDLPRIIRVLSDIKDMNGPRILHLRTVKGKGFAPAEKDPASWHAPGRFDPATGERISSPATGTKFQDVFGQTLLELARRDQRIVGITAAMSSGTSVSIMQREMPDRTFDVGISEGHAVTFAGGLASQGFKPFVAIYSAFLQRAYDQIINDVAIQRLPVVFCIDRAGLVGEDGVTHHGLFDLAYMRGVPGMTVAAPRDELWLRRLMYTAQLDGRAPDGPMAIRYPRGAGKVDDWKCPLEPVEIGRGESLVGGDSVSVLAVGPMVDEARRAVELARLRGIDASLDDMVFVAPLDDAILERAARKGMPIVTVEDGSVTGGLGSAVVEWLADRGYTNRVVRIGVPAGEFVTQGTVAELRRLCRMDADAILDAIVEAASDKSDKSDQSAETTWMSDPKLQSR